MMNGVAEGYYWARHDDGTLFVVLAQDGQWYACGVHAPLNEEFKAAQIVCPIPQPE